MGRNLPKATNMLVKVWTWGFDSGDGVIIPDLSPTMKMEAGHSLRPDFDMLILASGSRESYSPDLGPTGEQELFILQQ